MDDDIYSENKYEMKKHLTISLKSFFTSHKSNYFYNYIFILLLKGKMNVVIC